MQHSGFGIRWKQRRNNHANLKWINKSEHLAPTCNDGNTEEENDEAADEDDDEESKNIQEERYSKKEVNQLCMKFSMYLYVEDSIRIFSGNDAYRIESWINDFKDTANLFDWTKLQNILQKIVFAKKLLTESAKMLIKSESVIKTWKKKTILQ